MQERGELEALSLDEAKKLNIKLYEDVLPGNYEESFCNPALQSLLWAGFRPVSRLFY